MAEEETTDLKTRSRVILGHLYDVAARLHDNFLLREAGEVSGEWRVVRKDGSVCSILVTAGRFQLREEHVNIHLDAEDLQLTIDARISDCGPGVSTDYLDQTRERIGMQIVTAIVGQHSGEFVLEDPDTSLFPMRLPRILS